MWSSRVQQGTGAAEAREWAGAGAGGEQGDLLSVGSGASFLWAGEAERAACGGDTVGDAREDRAAEAGAGGHQGHESVSEQGGHSHRGCVQGFRLVG